MKYGLAVLVCVAICFIYVLIGAALGWKHGGGIIPIIILFAILGATWRGIISSEKNKDNE